MSKPSEKAMRCVDNLFEDLRDRRWLKWVFADPKTAPENSELALNAEAQDAIKQAWQTIIQSHTAEALSEHKRVLEMLNPEMLGLKAAEHRARGERRIPCFISVEAAEAIAELKTNEKPNE